MKYFYDHYFKPQDVTPMNLVFTKEHLVLSGLVITIILMVVYAQRKKGDVLFSQKVLRILGTLMLALELFRITWRVFYYGFNSTTLRFDWCNQVCMILPLIAIFRTEKYKEAKKQEKTLVRKQGLLSAFFVPCIKRKSIVQLYLPAYQGQRESRLLDAVGNGFPAVRRGESVQQQHDGKENKG